MDGHIIGSDLRSGERNEEKGEEGRGDGNYR